MKEETIESRKLPADGEHPLQATIETTVGDSVNGSRSLQKKRKARRIFGKSPQINLHRLKKRHLKHALKFLTVGA